MIKTSRCFYLFFCFLLASCAAPTTQRVSVSDTLTKEEEVRQYDLAAKDMVEDRMRLSRIHYHIATKAVALCGEKISPVIGYYAMRKGKGGINEAMARIYELKERPTVLFTLPDTPSEKAGLKAKDVIISINGVSTEKDSEIHAAYAAAKIDADIVFVVEREGKPITLTVKPEPACGYPAVLNVNQEINAYADGKKISITRGMMSFAKNDNELALVIAHELAHNTMKHMEAKMQNAGVGFLADLAIAILSRGQVSNSRFGQVAAGAFSQEFEAEADYVGLYMMAKAGMPIDDAAKFWRRMAVAHPANIKSNHTASHPSTAYRMVALEEAVKEIKQKIAEGKPLTPNLKDRKVEEQNK